MTAQELDEYVYLPIILKNAAANPTPATSRVVHVYSDKATFEGKASNSLLFAVDPVAIDRVMCDLLHAENPIGDTADDYLVYAAGLEYGTYERGDPWGYGYHQIDYLKITL